jgi:hypothetical protein
MRLPNGHRAELRTKRDDDVLNPTHGECRHKAPVFESALGITLANAHLLRKALLDAAAHSQAVIAKGDNGFGEVYVVRFSMRTTRGAARALSAWIVRHGEDFPRVVELLRGLSDEHRHATA